jgi:predicted DNA-binding transcriptional regulator AlpA
MIFDGGTQMEKASSKCVLDPKELAEYLGINVGRAYELMRSANFPSIRISPRRLIVPIAGLERWMEAQGRERAV